MSFKGDTRPVWATDEEYLAYGGNHCPACGDPDISGDEVTVDAGYAWQEVTCNACGAEWTDQYKLVGYV